VSLIIKLFFMFYKFLQLILKMIVLHVHLFLTVKIVIQNQQTCSVFLDKT